jgi:hypothetical protein
MHPFGNSGKHTIDPRLLAWVVSGRREMVAIDLQADMNRRRFKTDCKQTLNKVNLML